MNLINNLLCTCIWVKCVHVCVYRVLGLYLHNWFVVVNRLHTHKYPIVFFSVCLCVLVCLRVVALPSIYKCAGGRWQYMCVCECF